LLAEQLCHVDALEERIARLNQELAERLRPVDAELARLQTIPGVGRRGAKVLLAEIGPDMTRFPTAQHLASWAGMCRGNYESAGQRQKGTTRKGSPWLRAMLTEAAWGASHTKQTYLAAQFHHLAAKRGRKRARVAVGHSILVIAYHVLARQQSCQELGPTYLDARDRQATERRLVRRLEQLGLKVTIEHPSPRRLIPRHFQSRPSITGSHACLRAAAALR
jgi:hypothetical protein